MWRDILQSRSINIRDPNAKTFISKKIKSKKKKNSLYASWFENISCDTSEPINIEVNSAEPGT